ncbi:MAG TPA: hypothetical protein VG013_04630 [Gemmataceae bacterium]|jgi:hypothetical protein|nr:hypothetical protein [Gemmataceae bacterium]
MQHDDLYQSWKEGRAKADVPADFADRVMASVRAVERHKQPSAGRVLLLAVLSSRLGRIGICTLACLACVFRMAQVVALFIAEKG